MVHSKFGPFWVFSLRRCFFFFAIHTGFPPKDTFFRHPHWVSPKRPALSLPPTWRWNPLPVGQTLAACREAPAALPGARKPPTGRRRAESSAACPWATRSRRSSPWPRKTNPPQRDASACSARGGLGGKSQEVLVCCFFFGGGFSGDNA